MQTGALYTWRDVKTRNTVPTDSGDAVRGRVSVVDPRDRVADGELQLVASAQRHKRGLYHPSLAPEKIKIQNSKYSFY